MLLVLYLNSFVYKQYIMDNIEFTQHYIHHILLPLLSATYESARYLDFTSFHLLMEFCDDFIWPICVYLLFAIFEMRRPISKVLQPKGQGCCSQVSKLTKTTREKNTNNLVTTHSVTKIRAFSLISPGGWYPRNPFPTNLSFQTWKQRTILWS